MGDYIPRTLPMLASYDERRPPAQRMRWFRSHGLTNGDCHRGRLRQWTYSGTFLRVVPPPTHGSRPTQRASPLSSVSGYIVIKVVRHTMMDLRWRPSITTCRSSIKAPHVLNHAVILHTFRWFAIGDSVITLRNDIVADQIQIRCAMVQPWRHRTVASHTCYLMRTPRNTLLVVFHWNLNYTRTPRCTEP